MLVELKNDLITKPAKDIYHKYLLGQDVWYFKEHLKLPDHSKKYDELKYYISNGLDIHFNNIAIVGSAKTGISFNPSNKFRYFQQDSDFDIVLVSPRHFEKFWNAYVDMFYNQVIIPEYDSVSKSIFKKFISLKDPTQKHKDIKEWVKTVNPFVKDLQQFFGIAHDINYRIYDSWESVEKYHYFGISQFKNFVANNKKKEMQIAAIISSLINKGNGNN
ncbi:hypothetical protein LK994_13320 [Ferruginibacter lapsinanis]|uniref:hypothetical protein n=1 Tax=Ferruginibacter lapsinanis TaxID=563172 RepID=UPI001E4BAC6B|nr:hypothetical protein [Ferruginibacter lapsinanis]UEG49616.1 hypothetical protein LK994_13320 [Ferruginibacter lapsinanis]